MTDPASSFSRAAWSRNARAYETIRTMPFNADLAAGTLSEARFKHYITQDAHYLIGFGRALTLAAAKAPSPERLIQFAKSAEGAIVVERALHGSFFERYGITADVFNKTPLSPACHHYVSYLMATAYAEPYEVLLGALLPCFWIYAEVGHRHPRPRRGGQSLPGLDRHLCRRAVPRRGARHHRGHRRGRRHRIGHPARTDARGVHPRDPVGVDVLGFGLSAGDLAGLVRRYDLADRRKVGTISPY